MTIIKGIIDQGVVPVFVGRDVEKSLSSLEVLGKHGLRYVEIAIRTSVSLELIREASNFPGLIIGAGTVNSPQLLDSAMDAGARFIVTPGLVEPVVSRCIQNNVPIVPGIATPTEVLKAIEMGPTHLKLFPVESLGGLKYIDSLIGPFPEIQLMPSGGVNSANFKSFLEHKNVFAVSGSWMLPKTEIESPDVVGIQNLVREVSRVSQK